MGIGSGGHPDEAGAYGFEFPPKGRTKALGASIVRIKERWKTFTEPGSREIPILIGGNSEGTLKLVAEHGSMCNLGGVPVAEIGAKMRLIDRLCDQVGRDPGEVERTVVLFPNDYHLAPQYVREGADHIILTWIPPFDLQQIEALLRE